MTNVVKRCTIGAVALRGHGVTSCSGVCNHRLGLGSESPGRRGVPRTERSTRSGRARWPCLIVAVLIVTALLGGCRQGDDGTARTTTSSTRTASSGASGNAIDAATSEPVLIAYRAFWDVYKAASNPMNPGHPGITEVAVDAEYEQLVTLFAAHLDAREVFEGQLDLRPTVESVGNGEATVVDCMFDGMGIYATDTNPRVRRDRPDESRVMRRTTMKLIDGKWKASYVGPKGDPCGAP